MSTIKRQRPDFPVVFITTLPLLGLLQKIPQLLGWLEMGSWLNFIVFILIPIIWIWVVMNITDKPFIPLLFIGVLYGLMNAVLDLIYWLTVRESLDLPETNWSFDDLSSVINEFLIAAMQFAGNVGLGLLIGVIAGFVAHCIVKRRKNDDTGKS